MAVAISFLPTEGMASRPVVITVSGLLADTAYTLRSQTASGGVQDEVLTADGLGVITFTFVPTVEGTSTWDIYPGPNPTSLASATLHSVSG